MKYILYKEILSELKKENLGEYKNFENMKKHIKKDFNRIIDLLFEDSRENGDNLIYYLSWEIKNDIED